MPHRREHLTQARKSVGLTQEEMAHRLRVDVSTVKRWESGQTTPGAWAWPKIAKLLGITRAELIKVLASSPDEFGRDGAEPVHVEQVGQDHLALALQDAGRYLDESVASDFQRQLDVCVADDGTNGPTRTLPAVLSVVGAIEHSARQVKPGIRRRLLAVGARGAEFAGWLYRDAYQPDRALYWRDRAVEWAQEAGDWSMQGYILLKKSQSAWDERDAVRMLTLAQAAQTGPWTLSPLVRAEAAQQEARGLAMTGEPRDAIYRKLDEAWELFGTASAADRDPDKLGRHYSENLLTLQSAICYCEAGEPLRAAEVYRALLTDRRFSYRDRGYFLSLMASALAVAGEPDTATESGHEAVSVARKTNSRRTMKELTRVCQLLDHWRTRPAIRDLHAAVLAP